MQENDMDILWTVGKLLQKSKRMHIFQKVILPVQTHFLFQPVAAFPDAVFGDIKQFGKLTGCQSGKSC